MNINDEMYYIAEDLEEAEKCYDDCIDDIGLNAFENENISKTICKAAENYFKSYGEAKKNAEKEIQEIKEDNQKIVSDFENATKSIEDYVRVSIEELHLRVYIYKID
jgi:uncharacterized FlaG/YvyC family protein